MRSGLISPATAQAQRVGNLASFWAHASPRDCNSAPPRSFRASIELPEPPDAVRVEGAFVRYEGEVFEHRVGHQHPIERIAVWRQSPGSLPVSNRYQEAEETLGSQSRRPDCQSG